MIWIVLVDDWASLQVQTKASKTDPFRQGFTLFIDKDRQLSHGSSVEFYEVLPRSVYLGEWSLLNSWQVHAWVEISPHSNRLPCAGKQGQPPQRLTEVYKTHSSKLRANGKAQPIPLTFEQPCDISRVKVLPGQAFLSFPSIFFCEREEGLGMRLTLAAMPSLASYLNIFVSNSLLYI